MGIENGDLAHGMPRQVACVHKLFSCSSSDSSGKSTVYRLTDIDDLGILAEMVGHDAILMQIDLPGQFHFPHRCTDVWMDRFLKNRKGT